MKRHSIHIGINKYEDFPDLPFCSADAELMGSFFRNVAKYDSVKEFVDLSRNAILDAIFTEIKHLDSGDLLLITYSGHGMSQNKQWVMLAADSRLCLIQSGMDGIPLNVITEYARDRGVNLGFFIDSCPSKCMGTRGLIFGNSSLEKSSYGFDMSPNIDLGNLASLFIMLPSFAIEIPALGHGLFTLALDCALRGLYETGTVTLEEIRKRVDEHISAICLDNGVDSIPVATLTYAGPVVKLW